MSKVRLATFAMLVGCLWCASASAQVYRIIGPDGRVTFSDRPPPDAKATPAKTVPLTEGGSAATAALPAELRAAASRFPVVLYTGSDCPVCMTARGFLTRRGIPFTEKTVRTEDDIKALQRLAGQARVPFATIGAQHVRGFSEIEWAEYLDAAGYPKVSQLPPNFRNPDPTPLVAIQAAPAAAQRETPSQGPRGGDLPADSGPSGDNPAGIRF
jgi:glutaredoxin